MGRKFGQGESKYLAKVDLEDGNGGYKQPILVIDTVTEEEVGEEKDRKYILFFTNAAGTPIPKGLALNKTNETVLIDLFGDPDSSEPEGIAKHLRGQRVQLYFDPSIMFGGRRVGGLRLRGVQQAMQQPPSEIEEPPPPPKPRPEDMGEDIPF
jgi:hypothetical protein